MTSTCIAMPERSGMSEPAKIGEESHSSRWIRWPGLRKTPKVSNGRSRWIWAWTAPPGVPGRIAANQDESAAR
jgi:hypothetical protein